MPFPFGQKTVVTTTTLVNLLDHAIQLGSRTLESDAGTFPSGPEGHALLDTDDSEILRYELEASAEMVDPDEAFPLKKGTIYIFPRVLIQGLWFYDRRDAVTPRFDAEGRVVALQTCASGLADADWWDQELERQEEIRKSKEKR